MLGVIINTVAVLLGGFGGVIFRKNISEKISSAALKSVGLAVLIIGTLGAINAGNTLSQAFANDKGQGSIILVLSLFLGTVIGTLLDLDDKINRLDAKLNQVFKAKAQGDNIPAAFFSASLLFCVGAMSILGSISAGLYGDNNILIVKAIIDFVAALVLASSMGVGVALAGLSVLIYQGGIALLSQFIAPFVTTEMIYSLSFVGNTLIMALALNMLGITKFKLANMLPGVFLPILFCLIISWVPIFQ